MPIKPVAPACERNKDVILEKLKNAFHDVKQVLEIGSGTGQHAVYFAEHLPQLQWQPTDRQENIEAIKLWVNDSGLNNVKQPLVLDVDDAWPVAATVAGIFTANTLHIMAWPSVVNFFNGVGKHLQSGGKLCVYGPFNYKGEYTSASNAEFDMWLKNRDPQSGIRDFEQIQLLAEQQGLMLMDDFAMPANNRLLIWRKL